MEIKLKVKKKDILTDFLYVLFVTFYLVALLIWGMGSSLSQIRYYILMVAIAVAGLNLILSKNRMVYGKNILWVIPLGILLLILWSYVKI